MVSSQGLHESGAQQEGGRLVPCFPATTQPVKGHSLCTAFLLSPL